MCSRSAPASANLGLDVKEGKEGLGWGGARERRRDMDGASETGEPAEEDPEVWGGRFCRVVLE